MGAAHVARFSTGELATRFGRPSHGAGAPGGPWRAAQAAAEPWSLISLGEWHLPCHTIAPTSSDAVRLGPRQGVGPDNSMHGGKGTIGDVFNELVRAAGSTVLSLKSQPNVSS